MAGQQSQCPVTHPQAYLRNTRVERCGRVKQVVFAAFAAANSVMHGPLSVHTVYLNYSTYFPCVLAVFLMVSLKTSLAWHETKKTRHRETKCKSGIHLPSILASSYFDPLGPCHLIIQQKWKQGKKTVQLAHSKVVFNVQDSLTNHSTKLSNDDCCKNPCSPR